jgi:hypothetical protein
MKQRIRIAGATLAVAAGLVGAVAAPASAAAPSGYSASCLVGDVLITESNFGLTSRQVHQALRNLRQECDKGTLNYVVFRL